MAVVWLTTEWVFSVNLALVAPAGMNTGVESAAGLLLVTFTVSPVVAGDLPTR